MICATFNYFYYALFQTVQCKILPAIEHGGLNCTNGFDYGSRCQYTCARGFNSSGGSNSLTCGQDGIWKGTVPKCQAGKAMEVLCL